MGAVAQVVPECGQAMGGFRQVGDGESAGQLGGQVTRCGTGEVDTAVLDDDAVVAGGVLVVRDGLGAAQLFRKVQLDARGGAVGRDPHRVAAGQTQRAGQVRPDLAPGEQFGQQPGGDESGDVVELRARGRALPAEQIADPGHGLSVDPGPYLLDAGRR